MVARITWLPLHWDEFFDAVDGLSPALQIGCLKVLIHCYRKGISFPADDSDDLWICRAAGLERHRGWRGETAKIRERFAEDNGYLRGFLLDRHVKRTENQELSEAATQGEFRFIEERNLNSAPPDPATLLKTTTLQAARRICPGTDPLWLFAAWHQWSATPVVELTDRDKAFLGFCRAHRRRNARVIP